MRRRVAILALLVVPSVAALSLAAGQPDRSSPRATFSSFLESMIAVKAGDPARIDDAVACLDLSSVPSALRSQGPKLARDLKNYLDRVERVDVMALPADVEGTTWTYRKTKAGEVSLARTEDGTWLFSPATLEALPALLDSVRDRKVVEGIAGGGGAPRNLADWFRGLVPEALEGRALLLEHWQWVALLALAFFGVVIDRLVRLFVGIWLRRLLARTSRGRERRYETSLERPLGILVMAMVFRLGLPLLDLPLRPLTILVFASQIVIAAAGVWAAYRLVDVIAAHLVALAARTESGVDDILVPLGRRALKIIVVAFGLLFVAQNLDIDITSLLAGLGLGGLAFALAAKDTVENLFGSVTVLIDRPFQIGDWVVIDDLEGTVETIGFRSTRIRTFYNSLISVPNSRLVNSAVDNLGARRYRRLKCMISVEYHTPADRIEAFCEGIRELIRKHPYTRKDYYMVYFNAFADSSLNVLLYVFFETPDWATELRERHRLLVDIVRLAGELGVSFAFPTRTLHVASAPGTPAFGGVTVEGTPSAPSPPSTGGLDPARLGRDAAQRLLDDEAATPQPPVDFGDPDRIRPGP